MLHGLAAQRCWHPSVNPAVPVKNRRYQSSPERLPTSARNGFDLLPRNDENLMTSRTRPVAARILEAETAMGVIVRDNLPSALLEICQATSYCTASIWRPPG